MGFCEHGNDHSVSIARRHFLAISENIGSSELTAVNAGRHNSTSEPSMNSDKHLYSTNNQLVIPWILINRIFVQKAIWSCLHTVNHK